MSRKRKSRRTGRRPKLTPYFAYGSNLNLAGMRRRCPGASRGRLAVLRDYRLVFRGVADVIPMPGHKVWGGLWYCNDEHMEALDRYEGAPRMYRREWVEVKTKAGVERAVVYVMNGDWKSDLMMPSPYYLDTIVEGYEAWHLPVVELDNALQFVQSSLAERGITKLVPDGRKRMKAAPDPDAWEPDAEEDDEYFEALADLEEVGLIPPDMDWEEVDAIVNRALGRRVIDMRSPATKALDNLERRDTCSS